MFDEYILLIKYKLFPPTTNKWWLNEMGWTSIEKQNISFFYEILVKVSRSFNVIIKELPNQLSLEFCILYLMLRALDTVEDNSLLFNNQKEKKWYLKNFYKEFTNLNIDDKNCKELLENYDKIGIIFYKLPLKSQKIIKKCVRKMGKGMNKFINKDINTYDDYNKYCSYVAGDVGVSLTKLVFNFYENKQNCNRKIKKIANNAGKFLQKINIIRDFKEDLDENIIWYPKCVWSKYKEKIEDLNGDIESRNCLNELILDCLQLVPEIFIYHKFIYLKFSNPQIFYASAIPFAIGIATLNKLYDNPKVFRENVKIHKGLTLKIMNDLKNMDDLYNLFNKFVNNIKNKIRLDDPNYDETHKVCEKILKLIPNNPEESTFLNYLPYVAIILIISLVILRIRKR